MSSTYSTNLGIELMGTGDQAGNWGSTTNNNLGTLIEQAITGYGTTTVSGTTALTIPDGASGTGRNMVINITSGSGGTLTVPNSRAKLYVIFNNASGAVTVQTVSGTGISVPAGAKIILYSDGTNIVTAINYIPSATLPSATLSSPTLTGTPVAPTASPGTNTTQIATTAFVTAATGTLGTMSTQNANAVAITGGTISGLTSLGVSGTATATSFSGAGTGLTGTASSLSIGGNAATATSATSATSATTATNATNILGNSQSYQNVTGSRSSGATYTNSTGKPIWVWYSATSPTSGATTTAYVDGNLACYTAMDLYPRAFAGFVVPIGSTYSINCGGNLAYWLELR